MRHPQTFRLVRPGRARAGVPRGFTVVEIMVVVAVIIVLLSILVVATRAATRTARSANTTALMTNLGIGLAQFEGDHGYLPPILDQNRALIDPLNPNSGDLLEDLQDWFSFTSLADFLVGYGTHPQDGFGFVPDAPNNLSWSDERPPLGIRSPQRDGVWGATRGNGTLTERMLDPTFQFNGSPTSPYQIDQGQVYGPYIDVRSDKMFATWGGAFDDNGDPVLTNPGQFGYDENDPKVIVDNWGRPLRYYRRLYQNRTNPASKVRGGPSIADIYVLRPYRLPTTELLDAARDEAGDGTATAELAAAEFAIFSSGADKRQDQTRRFDTETEFNADNLVEVGP